MKGDLKTRYANGTPSVLAVEPSPTGETGSVCLFSCFGTGNGTAPETRARGPRAVRRSHHRLHPPRKAGQGAGVTECFFCAPRCCSTKARAFSCVHALSLYGTIGFFLPRIRGMAAVRPRRAAFESIHVMVLERASDARGCSLLGILGILGRPTKYFGI